MTQLDPQHLHFQLNKAHEQLVEFPKVTPPPSLLKRLGQVAMITLPSLIIGLQYSGATIAWSATDERAPLPPPLVCTQDPTDTGLARAILDERSGRPSVELCGGEADFVGGGLAGYAAGESALHQPAPHRCKLMQKIAELHHRLKARRHARRDDRQHRRAQHPLFPRLRERRSDH